MQAILTLLNRSTSVRKKNTKHIICDSIFLLSHIKYVEEAGLTDSALQLCVEIGFFHEGKLQDKVNIHDGEKFFIQSVWHNCSDK